MKKKNYEAASLEPLRFSEQDVICASGEGIGEDREWGSPDNIWVGNN